MVTIEFKSGRIEEKTQKEFIKEMKTDTKDFNISHPNSKITFISKVKSIDRTETVQFGAKECKKRAITQIVFENDWILYVNKGVDEIDTRFFSKVT